MDVFRGYFWGGMPEEGGCRHGPTLTHPDMHGAAENDGQSLREAMELPSRLQDGRNNVRGSVEYQIHSVDGCFGIMGFQGKKEFL